MQALQHAAERACVPDGVLRQLVSELDDTHGAVLVLDHEGPTLRRGDSKDVERNNVQDDVRALGARPGEVVVVHVRHGFGGRRPLVTALEARSVRTAQQRLERADPQIVNFMKSGVVPTSAALASH